MSRRPPDHPSDPQHLTIPHERSDRELKIYPKNRLEPSVSRVIDDSGNQFVAAEVRLGGDSKGGIASAVFPEGVAMNSVLIFRNLDRKCSELALLEVSASAVRETGGFGGGDETFQAQLHDIPVYHE